MSFNHLATIKALRKDNIRLSSLKLSNESKILGLEDQIKDNSNKIEDLNKELNKLRMIKEEVEEKLEEIVNLNEESKHKFEKMEIENERLRVELKEFEEDNTRLKIVNKGLLSEFKEIKCELQNSMEDDRKRKKRTDNFESKDESKDESNNSDWCWYDWRRYFGG